MKIQINGREVPKEQGVPQTKRPSVSIAPNLIRKRVMLDLDGNEIDPRTKRIITKATQ